MTRTKLITLFIAVVGSLLYFNNYLHPPETWESHNRKGLFAYQENRYAEAEKHFLQALEIAKTLELNDQRLHFSLNQLAEIYRLQSKFTEAEPVLKWILKIDEKQFGSQHPNLAATLNNLAGNYRLRGKHKESEALLKRALNILEASLGGEHPLVGNVLEHYAYLLRKMNRSAEAKKLEKRYQAIYSKQVIKNQ